MRSSRLTVEREGILTLPSEACEAARLRPGDILALETVGESLVLEVYRELLDGALEYMGDGVLRGFVERFLSRPITALEPGGHVLIPGEIFPLPKGSELSLYVDWQGTSHLLQLFHL
ncbi:MAG TPA: AbrB/MazE/SpoVT family DNA-binding domain-containing protein [Thermoanaerobaculia bacterium]|nr:AbrB/MazE/SpoVT family DNA-binding domain-containing protein [Thermoanaerobaculia bacterium]